MPARKQPVELVTYPEIEALTGVSQNLLRQWSYRGKLPEPDFRIGRSPAWYKATIDEWHAAREAKAGAAAADGKCPNVTPAARKDANGEDLRYSTCPACGGYLAILASGNFRSHKPVFKPGDPRIAENLAKQ